MDGNWAQINATAQRMAMAQDKTDEKAEAHDLVEHATERQRSFLWRALWDQGTDPWRLWAAGWFVDRCIVDMEREDDDRRVEE